MAAEKDFENRIKTYWQSVGIYPASVRAVPPDCRGWFIKYWGGGKFTVSGVPDLIACIGGRFLAIEVKGPKGKPSSEQIRNIAHITAAGGIAMVAYPDDFQQIKDITNKLISESEVKQV